MSAENSDLSVLGTWATDDLSATAAVNSGIGADSGLPDRVRFTSGVAKLIRRRRAQPDAQNDSKRLAIFILSSSAGSRNRIVHRVPMLDNGRTAIAGRLWLVSAAVVNGAYFDFDDVDDDALFRVVTDELTLGDTAAIVYDPRGAVPAVRYYPAGLADPEHYEPVPVGNADVTLRRIFEQIDLIHNYCMVTPEAQDRAGKLWEDASKWRPSRCAEDRVHMHLRIGLTTAFPTCTIRHEETSPSGRLDLLIEEKDACDPSRITRHALLELKVLRSFHESGDPVSEQYTLGWVDCGVRQAASYQIDRGARDAALCCFDMRKECTGEACFEHVRALAARLVVALKVWFVFASSEAYREFATSGR